MDELKINKNSEGTAVSVKELTTENRLEIIGEGLRKKYLSRLTEMQIAPVGKLLPLEEDLIDNVRMYHITEMVYGKGESVTDKFTTVFNTLSTYNATVFIGREEEQFLYWGSQQRNGSGKEAIHSYVGRYSEECPDRSFSGCQDFECGSQTNRRPVEYDSSSAEHGLRQCCRKYKKQ